MCNAPMRSHGDDTQQVVTDLSATQTQPMRVLHHGCNHRIIQFMHAREFGARVDQNRRPLLLEPILTIVLPHSAVWSFPFREMFA